MMTTICTMSCAATTTSHMCGLLICFPLSRGVDKDETDLPAVRYRGGRRSGVPGAGLPGTEDRGMIMTGYRCGRCGEEFTTNCDVGDIECPECG